MKKLIILALLIQTGFADPVHDYWSSAIEDYKKQNYTHATQSYTEAINLSSVNHLFSRLTDLIIYDRGIAYLKNGEFEKALADFTSILDTGIAKQKELALKQRAKVHLLMGNIEAYENNLKQLPIEEQTSFDIPDILFTPTGVLLSED